MHALGLERDARQMLQRAMELTPDDEPARVRLAQVRRAITGETETEVADESTAKPP
jgi:hypothetical protein